MVVIEVDRSVGPLAADRVPPDDRETKLGEERNRFLDVANRDAHVL